MLAQQLGPSGKAPFISRSRLSRMLGANVSSSVAAAAPRTPTRRAKAEQERESTSSGKATPAKQTRKRTAAQKEAQAKQKREKRAREGSCEERAAKSDHWRRRALVAEGLLAEFIHSHFENPSYRRQELEALLRDLGHNAPETGDLINRLAGHRAGTPLPSLVDVEGR